MAFNENDINDFVFDTLDIVAITSLVGSRIYHRHIPKGTTPTYPLIQYQNWNRWRPVKTLGNGRSHYEGSIRIIGVNVDGQRDTNTIKSAIEDAFLSQSATDINGATIIDLDITEYITLTENREKSSTISMSGIILKLMVEA